MVIYTMNKLALWYVHCNEFHHLVPSIQSQIEFVDKVIILDNTPDSLLDKSEFERLRDICKDKLILEHNMQFGAGFHDEYGVGQWHEVNFRNHAIKMTENSGADYMVQCDADETFSPYFFEYVKDLSEGIFVQRLEWFTKDRYAIPDGHVVGLPIKAHLRYEKNPFVDKSWQGGNDTLHCMQTYNSRIESVPFLWHNHMHYIYNDKPKYVDLNNPPYTIHDYIFNENMLYYGNWHTAFNGLI